MSQPSVIWWQPCVGNEQRIATLQDVATVLPDAATGGNLILNSGSPGTPETPETFTYNKMIRSIIIHSPDDLTGVTFVVSGIGAPINPAPPGGDGSPSQILSPITENIVAGNPTDAESVNIYSKITSIVATRAVPGGPATNVTVGFGTFGITDYVFLDYNRTAAMLSTATLQFVNQTSISGSVYMSLNRPESPDISQGGLLIPFGTENGEYVTFIPGFELIASTTTNDYDAFTYAFTIVWAPVSSTSRIVPDSLYFTFLQPGINS